MEAEDAVSGQWRESLGAGAAKPWLLFTSCYNQRHDVWRAFGSWLVERAATRKAPNLLEMAQIIAMSLQEEK